MTPTEFREIRKRLGYTQGQLAEAFGVDIRTWQRWEGGERTVPEPVRRVMAIADREMIKRLR